MWLDALIKQKEKEKRKKRNSSQDNEKRYQKNITSTDNRTSALL